jgi:hypothetical protein
MAVRQGGELQTTTVVLRKDQIRRMDALVELRSSRANRVSRSDIAREVFEAGLEVFLFGRSSDFSASDDAEPEAA